MLVKPSLTFNLKLKLNRMKRFSLGASNHYRLMWIVAIATSIVACITGVSTDQHDRV